MASTANCNDVAERLLVFGMKVVVLRVAHQAAAGAITAIGGATVGDKEEHAVRIAMDEAGHRRMFVLTERVEHLPRGDDHLVATGDDLLADRAIRVVPVDQVEKIRRDRQRQLLLGEEAARPFPGRQRHVALQLLDGREPVLQLPGPVPPVRLRHMRPKPLPGEPCGAVFGVGHRRKAGIAG